MISSVVPLSTAHQPLIGAKPGVTVEIAPGKKIELRESDPLPRFCIAEMVPMGGGTYRVVPRPLVVWQSLSQVSLSRLGITLSENTMRRLGRGKFIELRQISPSRFEFNFQSWVDHCTRCSDPEFWHTKDAKKRTNLDRYKETL